MNQISFEADGVPLEKLPQPAGWRLLIAPIKIEEVTKGGIVLTGESQKTLEYFRDVGRVVAMGSECYKHPKFQGGLSLEKREPTPWCKAGDIVQFSSYTGMIVAVNHEGQLHRLKVINDDEVATVINDTDILAVL
jgi:co-chaperonin GroES (HSP10)